jgi:hypothetical protein
LSQKQVTEEKGEEAVISRTFARLVSSAFALILAGLDPASAEEIAIGNYGSAK